jgi:hypothetical protein
VTMSTAASFLGVSIFVVFSCLALPYGTAFDSRLRYHIGPIRGGIRCGMRLLHERYFHATVERVARVG